MFCSILVIMILMGLAGMMIESAQVSIEKKRLIYKGDRFFYNSPVVFIYAVGGTMFYLATKALLWLPWYKVVLALTLIAIVWEYVSGYFCEHVAKKKFWDYSDRKFHIFGYVSLWSMMWWLIFAFIFYFYIFGKVTSLESFLNNNLFLTQIQDWTIFTGVAALIATIAILRIRQYSATNR